MINEISQNVVAGVSPTTTGNSDGVNRLQVRSTKDALNEASATKLMQSEADLVSKQSPEAEAEALGIREAVNDLNEFAQSVHRQLEFSVDDESGKTVVRVIDVDTGETIRDIPPEEIRNMQKHMREMSDRLFSQNDAGVSLLFKGEA